MCDPVRESIYVSFVVVMILMLSLVDDDIVVFNNRFFLYNLPF